MTKRTDAKELYLAALRGDAKAQRACTSAGKPCGGRCIPKHWNCRIKGEGNTPPTRGNKVLLSTEQKQKIKEARRQRRIRAVGTAAAIAGGAVGIAALSAKNPHKARRFFKGGPAVGAGLGVGAAIPGPTRKAAIAGNIGLAGAHAAGVMGAGYGQNIRGRRLYAQHMSELSRINQKLKSLDGRYTKLSEKLLTAKTLEESAKVGYAKRGTNKYALNHAPRSIAQQDKIRKQNLKSAESARRKAQLALNKFQDSTGYSKLVQKQIRLKKATNRIKDILVKPYNTKQVVGGVLNDYRQAYLKGFNSTRRHIRGIGVVSDKRGPKADPRHFSEKRQFQQDAAERTDKPCGNSFIPQNAKCSKGAGSAKASSKQPAKPPEFSKGFVEKHKKYAGYSPAFFKSLNKAERAEFKAHNEYAGSNEGKRERNVQAAKKITKNLALTAAVVGVGGYATSKALQSVSKKSAELSTKAKAKQLKWKDPKRSEYVERELEKMRGKGLGKYGVSGRRKTGRSFRPDDEIQRLDKKCGKSGIPDNWKCTKKTLKSAAKAVKNNPTKVIGAVYLGAGGALLAAGLLQARNARIRGKLKFGGDDRITPFKGVIGDADKVMQDFRPYYSGGDSMFGDVQIGKGKDGQNLVVKKITGRKNKLAPELDAVVQMEKAKVIDAKTASNLRRQRENIMESEVKLAKVAGEVGFGPKVVAAKENTLIMEVAKGRPLMDQYVSAGPLGVKLKQQELSRDDKAQILTTMAKMHTAGVAHNDMHLGNTFATGKGAEFIDFGTAQQGGGPVAMEFVRQMNKPRFGETFWQGNGYNLKTLDPKGYRQAENKIRKTIGKRIGTLRDNDIAKAVEKNPSLGPVLQTIVDDYYQGLVPRRNDAAEGRGKACGNSYIPKAHKCSKGTSATVGPINKKAITTSVAIGAVGALSIAGVLTYKNRKSVVPQISQKSIRALSSDQVKRGLNKIPGKLGEDARQLVGDAKLAAAKMGLSAQGAVCKSVNIKDNFSTWVNKDGTHLSVGSIGDSLLTFGAQRKGEVGGHPQFGLGFTIDTTYDAKGGMPPSQASKVIRTTRSMFKDQMAQLPDNAVLFAVPHQDDGKGGKRKSIYESMGFASLNKSGVKGDRLWALKNQGKFTRIPPEQHDHIAKMILG